MPLVSFPELTCMSESIVTHSPMDFPLDANFLLRAIVDSSDDAIASKNLNGIVMSWNQGAEKIFGYTEREMVGKSITVLIPEDRLQEEVDILQRIRSGERVENFDSVRIRKDGLKVDVSLTISPVRDAGGRIVGASKIARDITERKVFESQLIKQNLELEAAVKAAQEATEERRRQETLKEHFLASISHELRTPLQSILGWTQMLLSEETSIDEVRRGIHVIEKNAKSQVKIIEDLLDMSRILSGKIRLDLQPVLTSQALETAFETILPLAENKGVKVFIKRQCENEIVLADPQRLQQILLNLLVNAVKFTPPGGNVTCTVSGMDPCIEFKIEDTGRGIDKDFLPHLFERFTQAHDTCSKSNGGIGLGLAIARHLVEMHKGAIMATSKGRDCGSTFTVLLPRDPKRGRQQIDVSDQSEVICR